MLSNRSAPHGVGEDVKGTPTHVEMHGHDMGRADFLADEAGPSRRSTLSTTSSSSQPRRIPSRPHPPPDLSRTTSPSPPPSVGESTDPPPTTLPDASRPRLSSLLSRARRHHHASKPSMASTTTTLSALKTPPADADPDSVPRCSLKHLLCSDYRACIRYYHTGAWRSLFWRALRRQYWKWYAILLVVVVISAVIGIKHDVIVHKIHPYARHLRHMPAGWLIPIALLVIVSFPPLVGHEIIGILIGLVWGLWRGFGILCAGTFLGELATWYAFKGCCSGRAEKFMTKNKYYATLVQLIREKSFYFVLVLRFSAIPGHITTAISASAGANLFSYCAAAILTLPKQLAVVYLGTAFIEKSRKSHYISLLTMFLTVLGTGVAAIYIYYQMRLYIIKRNWQDQALEAQQSATDMVQVGGEDAIAGVDAPPPPPYPTIVAAADDLWIYKDTQYKDSARHRRPFLHSNSSFSVTPARTPRRSRSFSHAQGDPSPSPRHQDLITFNTPSLRGQELASPPLLAVTPNVGGRHRSGTVTSQFSLLSRVSDNEPPEAHDPAHEARGTASLDLWRPVDMTLGDSWRTPSRTRTPSLDETPTSGLTDYPPPAPARVSGREIARDADEYAVRHGASRPQLGRTRGESSAALLPRPPQGD